MIKRQEEQLDNERRIKLLQQVREEKQEYIKKQFSKSLHYRLLRFWGASWWWYIRQLTGFEETLNNKIK